MRITRLVMLLLPLVWCSTLTAQAPVPAKSVQLRARVDAEIRRIADAADGVVGYVIVDLTNGDRFERQADQPFPTASTIKLAILYELLRQVDAKRLTLDEPKPIPERLRVGGSGVLQQLSNPVLSLRDCAILMMMASDNTATNAHRRGRHGCGEHANARARCADAGAASPHDGYRRRASR
jgi:beta-lactamase class A